MPPNHPKNLTKHIVAAALLSSANFAQSDENLFDLPLEDLLNMRVSTGNLKEVSAYQSPSAITVIRQDHIDASPAKNIVEILEIYVPGLMLMAHSEGDKIGLRGNIAAENYKLLLLLNGKNITNMVYEGAMLELDQWDLSDIEKIEVVRGPGSVTYGTGAIAGVINIITKSANSKGQHFNLSYNPTYQSKGFSYQSSQSFGAFDTYLFGSYRRTEGLEDPDYFAPAPNESSDIRYIGKRSSDEYGPQPYLADSLDRPQIKLHADIHYGDAFSMFTRYTQSGQAHHFRTTAPQLDSEDNLIGEVNSRQVSLRSFIIAPEYTFTLGDTAQPSLSILKNTFGMITRTITGQRITPTM